MKTQLINFTIPIELLKKIDLFAKKQTKSRSEVLRDAARALLNDGQDREQDFVTISQSAKKINLLEEESITLINKIRSKLPMNR